MGRERQHHYRDRDGAENAHSLRHDVAPSKWDMQEPLS